MYKLKSNYFLIGLFAVLFISNLEILITHEGDWASRQWVTFVLQFILAYGVYTTFKKISAIKAAAKG